MCRGESLTNCHDYHFYRWFIQGFLVLPNPFNISSDQRRILSSRQSSALHLGLHILQSLQHLLIKWKTCNPVNSRSIFPHHSTSSVPYNILGSVLQTLTAFLCSFHRFRTTSKKWMLLHRTSPPKLSLCMLLFWFDVSAGVFLHQKSMQAISQKLI